jgi:ketosteroid isomerase-like protein
MRRPVSAAASLGLWLCVTAIAAAAPQEASTEALMQADRAFFAAAAEGGLEGWMSFMAEDAARMPAIGMEVVSGTSEIRRLDAALFASPDVQLAWEPEHAYLFADGRHGITTGPYEVRMADGTVGGRGRYLTFWRLEAEGWKVIFDTGAPE